MDYKYPRVYHINHHCVQVGDFFIPFMVTRVSMGQSYFMSTAVNSWKRPILPLHQVIRKCFHKLTAGHNNHGSWHGTLVSHEAQTVDKWQVYLFIFADTVAVRHNVPLNYVIYNHEANICPYSFMKLVKSDPSPCRYSSAASCWYCVGHGSRCFMQWSVVQDNDSLIMKATRYNNGLRFRFDGGNDFVYSIWKQIVKRNMTRQCMDIYV